MVCLGLFKLATVIEHDRTDISYISDFGSNGYRSGQVNDPKLANTTIIFASNADRANSVIIRGTKLGALDSLGPMQSNGTFCIGFSSH